MKHKLIILTSISILILSCFFQYASANSTDKWKERNYYRENQLILTEKRTFDDSGNIIESSIHYAEGVPLGSRTEYLFDESGKRISGTVIYEDGTIGNSIPNFVYDTDGNIIEIIWKSQDNNLIEKYEYDNCGNETLFSLLDSDGTIISQRITDNIYDQTQRLIQSYNTDIIIDAEGNTVEKYIINTYHYDQFNRLITLTMEDQNKIHLGNYEYIY